MDLYCAECGGMVNAGGACPKPKRPANCPLEKTEQEHYAELAQQQPAAPAADTVAALAAEVARLNTRIAELEATKPVPSE
jgi:hypothetical protein